MTQQKWNRADDWAVHLAGVVEHHNQLAFQYGVSDCGILVFDAIKAVLGEDVLSRYRGYKTKTGAGRVLRKAGFENIGELLAKHFKECDRSAAMRGDVGVADYNGEICGGVFIGTGFAAKSETGIFFADYDQVIRSFEVR